MSLALAGCHKLHLECELKKTRSLLEKLTTEGITFEEHTRQHFSELESEFPGIKFGENKGALNIMEAWYETSSRRADYPPYPQSTFKMMNVVFLKRIKFIHNPDKSNKESLQETFLQSMQVANLISRGFTFSYIINIEKVLQQLMFTHLKNIFPDQTDEILKILDEVNSVVMETWIKYFYDLAENARIQNEELLKNILPESIVHQLREHGEVRPEYYESATVGFTDFVGFSKTAGGMDPGELTKMLDIYFQKFDQIIETYGLEKLKTIGDSYMFAGGVPDKNPKHAELCVLAALDMQKIVSEMEIQKSWKMRIGLHSGPLVAGIIGKKKFSFDIWGDTVNIASRMESAGEGGRVNISRNTKQLLPSGYTITERGFLPIKNLGEVEMFFVESGMAQ